MSLRPSLFPPSTPFGCWPWLWLIHLPGLPPDPGRPVGWSVSYNNVWVSPECRPDVWPVLMDSCPFLFWSLSCFSLVLTTLSLFLLACPACSMLNCALCHSCSHIWVLLIGGLVLLTDCLGITPGPDDLHLLPLRRWWTCSASG